MDTVLHSGSQPHRPSLTAFMLEKVVGHRFPKRFKRLIYISSVLAIVKEVREPEQSKVLVNKLNDVFKIAKYPEAMMYSMYIKSIVWRDLPAEGHILINGQKITISQIKGRCLSDSDCRAVGEYFNKQAPKWLRYGSNNLMIHDVVVLMQHLTEFNTECSTIHPESSF